MTAKYQNLGFQALEMVETAPISLLNDIISSGNAETGLQLEVEWSEGIDDDALRLAVLKQLNSHRVEELRPLEDLCQRIRALAAGKGPTSLTQVVLRRRSNEEYELFQAQPDELCRSAWVFLHFPADFEDAEAFYAARQYRDFGKMYDSFEINADGAAALDAAAIDHQALVSLLTARLQLPSQVMVRTLDLHKTSNHPSSIMVIVRHGGPLSSVFNHKDNGMRGTIYFRPPNEATLIWTPSSNVMEICGPTPQVRKQIGDAFAEVALKADLSKKPLNWRRYDLARFNSSFALTLPVWDDVEIIAAKLIEVELRLGT